MTPIKTIRLITLGDAKRLTRGVVPTGFEMDGMPGSQPTV